MNMIKIIKKFYYNIRTFHCSPNKRANVIKRIYKVRMGKNCMIYSKCGFSTEPYLIELGNDVLITNGCSFITHDGGVHVLRNLYPNFSNIDKFGQIKIGNNCYFGNNCLILPNVRVGDNVIIGAGSILTKEYPSNCVLAGVPARIICTLEEYALKNSKYFDNTFSFNDLEKKEYLFKKFNLK